MKRIVQEKMERFHENINLNKTKEIILLNKTQSAFARSLSKVLFYGFLPTRNEQWLNIFLHHIDCIIVDF